MIMAEGGADQSLPELQMEDEDLEDIDRQKNELAVLESMFEQNEFEISKHDNPQGHMPGGSLIIPISPPDNFHVKITRDLQLIKMMTYAPVLGRGRKEKILKREAERRGEATPGKNGSDTERLYRIKRLSPFTLTFAYPDDYPSVSPPMFTLSCCWLEKKNLTRLCEKLDEIWTKRVGEPVIYNWRNFLSQEVFHFLDIKSPYDLGRVLSHLFTHSGKSGGYHTPRPFDLRGIQNFCDLEEVLQKVLDFDLVKCTICGEEKPGDQFLRLVKCHDHVYCKECMKGWLETLIKGGSVVGIRCPGEKCEQTLLPTEVAAVVSEEAYQRYDELLLKSAVERMNDVKYCPRSFCQTPVLMQDNLGHCSKCQYAFCGRCKNAYHYFSPCKIKEEMLAALVQEYENATTQRKRELEMNYGKKVIQKALDETKSTKWLEANSKQCPCCSTFIQKTDGCNSMYCQKCGEAFCYICGRSISRRDPYAHFRQDKRCSGQLFAGVDINEINPEDDLLEELILIAEEGMFDDAES